MPTDLERALGDVAAHLDDAAPTISVEEVLAAADDSSPHGHVAAVPPRRWLAAAAAALVLIAGVAAVVAIGRRDGAVTTVPPPTSIESDALVDVPPPDWSGIGVVDAQVIGRSPDSLDLRVEIDRGSVHGVLVGMPVIDAAGLVGKITYAYPETSIVSLLTSADVPVGAKSVSTGAEPEVSATGVVRGRDADGHLRFDSPSGALPNVGDHVLTAGGNDSLQPPDLPIGEVVNVSEDGTADVEVSADLSRLDRVQVLLYRPASSSAPQQPPSRPSTSADGVSPDT